MTVNTELLKRRILNVLQAELKLWQDNLKTWTVNNQHDEYRLEEAVQIIQDETKQDFVQTTLLKLIENDYNLTKFTANDFVNFFHLDTANLEIHRAWYD